MTTRFSFNEALKLAVAREKESQALYKKLRETTTNEEIKKIFNLLYNQEVMHEAFFSKMLKNTPPEASFRSTDDNENVTYIIDQLNNTKTSSQFYDEQLDNPKTVLDYAIARETDAIIFYVGLKELMLPEDQEKITDIIWQEANHAMIISNLKQKVLSNRIKL